MNKYCLKLIMLGLLWTQTHHAATITVNTADLTVTSDSDGLCHLQEAIDAANNNLASGAVAGECVAGEMHPVVDVIEFDVAMLPAVIPTFVTFDLQDSVHIKGPAKELLTLTGIALNRAFYIFNSAADAEFMISDLTIADYNIRLPIDDYGAAIWAQHFNGASLTIERVHFWNNTAQRGGGALGLFGGNNNTTVIKDSYFEANTVNAENTAGTGGGAIFVGASQNLIIENTTFDDNLAHNFEINNSLDDAAGGAILIRANGPTLVSTVTIEQSTFSDNTAYGVGGAIAMGGPGYPNESSEVTIRHSTFVGNAADFNDDQSGNDSGGGAIYNGSSNGTNLFNNLIAGNTDQAQNAGPDLEGGYITFGHNLIGNNQSSATTFPAGQPNVNDDFVGESPIPILPLVAPVAANGGPTPTRLPLINSVAIDQGQCAVLTTDQRGQHNDATGFRIVDQAGISNLDQGCDIGAVELGAIAANPIPVAVDDSYQLLEGEVLIVSQSIGVLNNDNDNDDMVVISAGSFASSSADAQGDVELRANGAFTFVSTDSDAFGDTAFDYVVSDQYNSTAATVNITVLPVNDAPFYLNSQPSIVAPLDQYLTYPNWATDMSAGPANESSQSLVFVVEITNAPTGFFSAFPSIDAQTGDLSFELASSANGMAEILVSLRDDGGTDHGGTNTYSTNLMIVTSDVIFQDSFESD